MRRSTAVLGLALLILSATPAPAAAERRAGPATRVVRGAAVVVAGRPLWRATRPGQRVLGDPVWSRARDAVAFATRDRAGLLELVVVLVGGDVDGHVMSWPVPASVLGGAPVPAVSWLGGQRVAVGRTLFEPSWIASWRLRQL